MSKKKKPGDYEIGYGKPPKNTQFQKGISGNSKGRPRKPLDFDHELIKESEALMTINENGRPKRVSKHNVALKQLLNQSMTGNIVATRLYLKHRREALERLALIAGTTQSNSSGKYTAKDLTEDQLTEIILRGEEERKKLSLSNVLNTE
jgi:hypothetical protein